MGNFFDNFWEEILREAAKWQKNETELMTLGIGKKAKPFTVTKVTLNSLEIDVHNNKYSKDLFFRAVQLLHTNGKAGAELRPIKKKDPVEGTIDYVVRPINDKGKRPPMRATWIGAILVHSGVAIQIKDRPITIRLNDKYLTLDDER